MTAFSSRQRDGGNPQIAAVDTASDLLSAAVLKTKSRLDRKLSVQQRIKIFWAAVKAARQFRAADAVAKDFTALAVETRLTRDLGYHGREDIEHVVSWALRGWNPFGAGTLQ